MRAAATAKWGQNVNPSWKNLHKGRVSARELNQSRDSNSLLHFVQQAVLFALLTDEIGCKCWCGWARKAAARPLLSLRHSLICWVRLGFESDTGKDRALVTLPVHVAWQSLRSFHPTRPFQTCTVCIPANFKNLAAKNSIFQEVYSDGLRLKDLGAEGRKENSSPGCKGAVHFYCWNKHWLYRQTIRLSHFGTAVLFHMKKSWLFKWNLKQNVNAGGAYLKQNKTKKKHLKLQKYYRKYF